MRAKYAMLVLATMLTLAGCNSGGGGSGNGPGPTADGFVSFTQQLAASAPEDADASDVDGVAVTKPEDVDPENIS